MIVSQGFVHGTIMKQDAAQIPELTYQRKAAIAHARAKDHQGSVRVKPLDRFDLDRTIFNTLEGTLARVVIQSRLAKEPTWYSAATGTIDTAYGDVQQQGQLPEIDPLLMRFLKDDCDFEVEHADGSFLDHLYFCYEYSTYHYPEQSALVMLLHSILGTGTNTFAMEAKKIPTLQSLMSEFDWSHVESFPSMLRLLYDTKLRKQLRQNIHKLDEIDGITLHRVIDNKNLTLSAEDFWIQLNYQLIHLVDFLPVSNWTVHANETAFIVFRDLYDLLERANKLYAKLDYIPSNGPRKAKDEELSLTSWLATWIPIPVSEVMAAKSVHKFSSRIGHSMSYELLWR